MYAPKFYAILVLCLYTVPLQPAIAQSRLSSNDEVIEFVRTHTEERLAAVLNYRCTQVITQPRGAANPERRILTIDPRGRGQIVITGERSVTTTICDGNKTIELRENLQPNGMVSYSASIVPAMQQLLQTYNEPWKYMGGTLVAELTEVSNSGGRIHGFEMPTGQFRIDIRPEPGTLDVIILDPNQGYVPIERKTIAEGSVKNHEAITFERPRPDVWFPTEVRAMSEAPADERSPDDLGLKYRFINITVNSATFERSLSARFPIGTEVSDTIAGEFYVVGSNIRRPLEEAASPTTDAEAKANTVPGTGNEPWRQAFFEVYRLESNEVLRYVAPPFIPEREEYLKTLDLGNQGSSRTRSQLYAFDWSPDAVTVRCVSQRRSAALSTVLEYVIGLGSYEYEGPMYLLNTRLTGDWIVREGTSTEQRLKALEQIIEKEAMRSVTFVKDSEQDIVMRATGTYQFRPLSETPDRGSIFVQAGNWNSQQGNTVLRTGNGPVSALLDQVGNAIGMQIINETAPSDQELRWMLHESSMLRDIKNVQTLYNTKLGRLLNELTAQTNLTFRPEIGSHVLWRVTTQRALAAESN